MFLMSSYYVLLKSFFTLPTHPESFVKRICALGSGDHEVCWVAKYKPDSKEASRWMVIPGAT